MRKEVLVCDNCKKEEQYAVTRYSIGYGYGWTRIESAAFSGAIDWCGDCMDAAASFLRLGAALHQRVAL